MIGLFCLLLSFTIAYIVIPSEEQILLKVRKITKSSVPMVNLEGLYNPNAFMYYIDRFGLRNNPYV